MSSHHSSFFGRRKGRSLSERQKTVMSQNLPALQLDPSQFAFFTTETWLEIGFGAGDHLVNQAKTFPHVTILGVEVFENGISSLLKKIEQESLTNILIYPQEISLLMPYIPPQSLDKLFILFPDPWPKIKHKKRRLINEKSLGQFAECLKETGCFYMASDCEEYIVNVKNLIERSPMFLTLDFYSERPEDWPLTNYNRKAMKEGRPSWYLKAWR